MGVIRTLARGVALVGAVATGGALAVTARSILATPQPLESALEGESRIFRFRSGDVFYKVRGPQGAQPVLLLHGIHLGASSFEWRKNFSELSQGFRVFAPDLPGFGLSDRPAIEYTGELYTQFVTDFAREIVQQPAMVVARGQSAAFAVGAAALDEQLFHRLVLISPSGIVHSPTADGRGLDGPDGQGWLLEAMQAPLRQVGVSSLGQVPYALLTNKPALAYLLLRQSYADREKIDQAVLQHLYATTHQYGARFAPLAFMSGRLDVDVENAFSMLSQPVLLVWGQEDLLNSPLNAEDLHMLNPRARLEVLSHAGNAVQEEREQETNELLRAWFLAPSDLVDPSRLERASVAPVTPSANELSPEEPPEMPASRETPAENAARKTQPAKSSRNNGQAPEVTEQAARVSALEALSEPNPAAQAEASAVEEPPAPEAPPPARRATTQGAAKGQRRTSAKQTPARAARSGDTEQPDTPRQASPEEGKQPPGRSAPKRKR
ncbi:MAG TPA: alpha/beta fold hydrolase [Ktedonobacterales bacterium]|jgi:pimeloyl-ACP methyl ester carboxylesterase